MARPQLRWNTGSNPVRTTLPASPWPDQTNTGYQNHPAWPGSFTGGTDTVGITATTGQTYNFWDFQAGIDVGTSSVDANNVTFNGCRFQFSANISNQGNNSAVQALLYGSNITFNYCTFQPFVSNYPVELTGEETSGNVASYVEYGKSYQFAIEGSGAFSTHVGDLLVDHCDMWGFGNALELSGSTVAHPHIVRNSWFHHGGDPFTVNVTANQYHNDVWLCSNGAYFGAQFVHNRAEIWGNTNVIAFQGAGSYDDAVITGNLLGGDQETVSLSASGSSVRITFTDNTFSTRIGRSVGSGDPLRSWAVSDSGTGSLWRRNKVLVAPSEAFANYPGAHWGNPAWNGQYWWPGDGDATLGHATDFTG